MDSLQWFKAGDVITDDNRKSKFHNKRIIVERIDLVGEDKKTPILRGRIGSVDCAIDKSDNLILLERPGLGFKVGDKAKAFCGDAEGYRGIVIVIDPSIASNGDFKILVEFKEWTEGHNGLHWKRPWYPRKYKTESLSRWWCSARHLKLINQNPNASAI